MLELSQQMEKWSNDCVRLYLSILWIERERGRGGGGEVERVEERWERERDRERELILELDVFPQQREINFHQISYH